MLDAGFLMLDESWGKNRKYRTHLMIFDSKTELLPEILIKNPTSNLQHLYETI